VFDKPVLDIVEKEQAFALSDICEPRSLDRRKELEALVAEAISRTMRRKMPAHNVIVHVYSFRDPLERSFAEGPMLIEPRARKEGPRHFEDVSQIFSSIKVWQEEKQLAVYCPVEYDTGDEKYTLLRDLDGPIRQVLASFGGGENGGR
jgi:hypothetical protein